MRKIFLFDQVEKKDLLKMIVLTFLFLYLCCESCLGGDPYYVAEWSDAIKSCPNFDNTHFNCDDVELGSSAGDDDDGSLSIRGKLVFFEDMEDGIKMNLQISKCTELGDELMYSASTDFCSSLTHTDTPWYPLVVKLNSTSCPIPKNEYPMDGLEISLDFAKDVLTHETCGEYKARLELTVDMDMVSCHMISIAVAEKYSEK